MLHEVVHVPQLEMVSMGVSQPSFASPLQSAQPGSHVPIVQEPATQAPLSWRPVFDASEGQVTPHPPQLPVSEPPMYVVQLVPSPGQLA